MMKTTCIVSLILSVFLLAACSSNSPVEEALSNPDTRKITLTSNHENNDYIVGDNVEITWETSILIDGITVIDSHSSEITIEGDIEIFYSKDGGSTWETITAATDNDGAYSWIVPDDIASQITLRVAIDNENTDEIYDETQESISILGDLEFLNTNPDILYVGDNQELAWTSKGSIGSIDLSYSTDDGLNWIDISTQEINDGSFEWLVPDEIQTSIKVKAHAPLYGIESIIDRSIHGRFSFIAPTESDNFYVNGDIDISWDTAGSINEVDLYYSIDFGINWITISEGIPNTGNYTWDSPIISENDIQLKITDHEGSTENDSDVFSTRLGEISITAPLSSNIFIVDDSTTITWETTGNIEIVDLFYSYDAGANWISIDESVLNLGSYAWDIPDAINREVQIKITDEDSASTSTSETFAIRGALSLLSHNGGETYLSNTQTNIAWSKVGSIENVNISYSSDNGAIWNHITSSSQPSNSFQWTAPGELGSDYLIRIYDEKFPEFIETSNTTFSIDNKIYVDAEANSSGNGYSWSTPLKTIQEAVGPNGIAKSGHEVWVAKGTYTKNNLESELIDLWYNVKLYGGFTNGDDWEDRNWELNQSILDGNNNTGYIVTANNPISYNALIDGFILKNGSNSALHINTYNLSVKNCTFYSNSSSSGGAAIILTNYAGWYDSPISIDKCQFINNSSNGNGGAIHAEDARVIIKDSTFTNNSANANGGSIHAEDTDLIISDSTFVNNSADNGGSIYLDSDTDGNILNCTFVSNKAISNGGAIGFFFNSSSKIIKSSFIRNEASEGGAIWYEGDNWADNQSIQSSLFHSNVADSYGGALKLPIYSFTMAINTSTFINNQASNTGSAIYGSTSYISVLMNNCIIYGNSGNSYAQSYGAASYTNCLFQGSGGSASWAVDPSFGTDNGGNIDVDPLFIDPDGADDILGNADDNYRLQETSPAIDAGDNSLVPTENTEDLDGNDRINGTVDMGAYEDTPSGDT